jgi:MoxR-like ATPase
MVPRTETITVGSTNIAYGDVIDAIAALVKAAPADKAAGAIPVYDMTNASELGRLIKDVTAAYDAAPPVAHKPAVTEADDDDDDVAPAPVTEIAENKSLIGIDPSVYRQINAALKSGKRHLMFYGPPGTGKTALARYVSESLSPGKWTLVTGSADWSSQDIIGGYQPVGSGDVAFQAGVLLRAFDQPLIIDEMNRCDIDKVLGPLFTVLSGQHTTLPYRLNIKDEASPQYVILAAEKAAPAAHEFAPGVAWRLIATINSIDKASLYQMSYALSRRFGWIYVDVPKDLRGFIATYLAQETGKSMNPPPEKACPLAALWAAVNEVRPIGPAPIIDAIGAIRTQMPDAEFFDEAPLEMREAVLDAIDMVVLPMLDGIVSQDAAKIADAAIAAFKFDEAQATRVRARLASLAV